MEDISDKVNAYVEQYIVAGTSPMVAYILAFGIGEDSSPVKVKKVKAWHGSKEVQQALKAKLNTKG